MTTTQNVLFIMADQFRADHLGCDGHPYLKTTNLDALAKRGVRFSRAFVNSGVCGPSRMSYYTGRYPSSHGTTWNRVPLSIGEVTFGEYLAMAKRELVLAGKTHVIPDLAGMKRLGFDGASELGYLLERGGFRELERYDGHHPPGLESGYPAYLRRQGYISDDPWTDFVIAGQLPDGQIVSGWNMRNTYLAARVAESHSETAYMTNQALEFMRTQGDKPWVLHLSYVKPHWPYMAPAPYHNRYTAEQCLPVVRSEQERQGAHPVVAAYRQHEESRNFTRDECIRIVRPAYQGLIQQLDDHLGRLFEYMDGAGLMKNTLIVFTSDHGDLLGDHWLGEKELFYDAVQRVPCIVMDPDARADITRGTVDDRFVEAVDMVPTFLEALGVAGSPERIEGRSLLPLTRGEPTRWRDAVFSELDYSFRQARLLLNKTPQQSRAYSLRTTRWRYVYWLDEPEQLFDLENDPNELNDLGREALYLSTREALRTQLLEALARRKRRVTMSDEAVERGTNAHKRAGVFFGQW
jgi:arylsulfatase A-like enzyme